VVITLQFMQTSSTQLLIFLSYPPTTHS
jgi:hypothetical protein